MSDSEAPAPGAGAVSWQTQNPPPPSSGNWLLSFGDLLTLLLCFFLAIVALGPLNPRAKAPIAELTSGNNINNFPKAQLSALGGRSGTALAHNDLAKQGLAGQGARSSLEFGESDFSPLTQLLTPSAIGRLKTDLLSGTSADQTLLLEVCRRTAELRTPYGAEVGIERALALRRQLSGSDWHGVLRMRLVDGDCAASARIRLMR